MISVDDRMLIAILDTIDSEFIDDKEDLVVSIIENMNVDFNKHIISRKFPNSLILKSDIDEDSILLSNIKQQNYVLDYLYNSIRNTDLSYYCEVVFKIKNIINLKN